MYLIATLANAADLATSFYAFNHGFVEMNMYAIMSGNSYLSAVLGVLTFQALITVFLLLYLVLRRLSGNLLTVVTVVLAIYAASKVVVSVYNALLVLDYPLAVGIYELLIKPLLSLSSAMWAGLGMNYPSIT